MKRLTIGACVGIAALGLATSALAGKFHSAEVKITGYELGAIEGQVRSDFPLCQEKRRVELWEDHDDVSDSLVGTVKTAGSGGWSVNAIGSIADKYYAVATHKEGTYRKKNGKKKPYDCPEVTSEVFIR